jgi:hypothetical protein
MFYLKDGGVTRSDNQYQSERSDVGWWLVVGNYAWMRESVKSSRWMQESDEGMKECDDDSIITRTRTYRRDKSQSVQGKDTFTFRGIKGRHKGIKG